MGNNNDVLIMECWSSHVDATTSMSQLSKDALRPQERAEQEITHSERQHAEDC